MTTAWLRYGKSVMSLQAQLDEKVNPVIRAKDAEIAALKARLAGTVYDGSKETLPAYGQGVSVVRRESLMVQTFPMPGKFVGGKWYVIDRGVETVVLEPKIGDRWWPLPGGGE